MTSRLGTGISKTFFYGVPPVQYVYALNKLNAALTWSKISQQDVNILYYQPVQILSNVFLVIFLALQDVFSIALSIVICLCSNNNRFLNHHESLDVLYINDHWFFCKQF